MPSLEKLCYRQKSADQQFESFILRNIQPHHLVLDAGCGRWAYARVKGKCCMAIGVDADREVTSNRCLDTLIHADLNCLPFADNAFDIVMSWTVLEHIDDPNACFNELARVCKPGGLMIHATPNLMHYANFFIKVTPYWFHKWFIHTVMGQREDPYPTLYKVNTPHKLKKMLRVNGFIPLEIRLIDNGPVYLSWFSPVYALGLLYHYIVNRINVLSYFRAFMICISIRQAPEKTESSHA